MVVRQALARSLLILVLGFALGGCELVANFDRSKIPSAHPDAGKRDAGHVTDAGTPRDAASEEDAGALGMDAGP